jgi:hypothetical protein
MKPESRRWTSDEKSELDRLPDAGKEAAEMAVALRPIRVLPNGSSTPSGMRCSRQTHSPIFRLSGRQSSLRSARACSPAGTSYRIRSRGGRRPSNIPNAAVRSNISGPPSGPMPEPAHRNDRRKLRSTADALADDRASRDRIIHWHYLGHDLLKKVGARIVPRPYLTGARGTSARAAISS